MEYLHQTKMKEEIAEEVKKCHFCDKEFPQNTLDQHFVLHHLNVHAQTANFLLIVKKC